MKYSSKLDILRSICITNILNCIIMLGISLTELPHMVQVRPEGAEAPSPGRSLKKVPV